MEINVEAVVIMAVAAIVLGALLPTITGYMADIKISKTLSLTATSLKEDVWINNTGNTSEMQMKWDISGMTKGAGVNITRAILTICNLSALTETTINTTRIPSQTWNDSLQTNEYQALATGASTNSTITTSGSCITLNVAPLIFTDSASVNTSLRLESSTWPTRNDSVDSVNGNDTQLYMNVSGTAWVGFYSAEASSNTPTLTISYSYPIPSGTQAMILLIPLMVVLVIIFAFIKRD